MSNDNDDLLYTLERWDRLDLLTRCRISLIIWEKCSDDGHPGIYFLVWGCDPDRNDYHLGYLAADVRSVDDSGVDGFVSNVRIGAAVGA